MDEEYELFKAYADQSAVGADFVGWAQLSASIVSFLSDPYRKLIRDRVFDTYKRVGLEDAQVEALRALEQEVREGKVQGPPTPESHRLLSGVRWSVFLAHQRLGSVAGVDSEYVDFANKYRFVIWDHIDSRTRRDLLKQTIERPYLSQFLLSIGAPPRMIGAAATTGRPLLVQGVDTARAIDGKTLLPLVIDSYLKRAQDSDLRREVRKTLSSRGFVLCDSLDGWKTAYDSLASRPIDHEDYDPDFIRFLLCCATEPGGEPNPSLTTEAVLRLVGDDDPELVNRRSGKLLSPFQTIRESQLPVSWAGDILATWLYELVVALADRSWDRENADDPFWSLIDCLDERQEPPIKVILQALPIIARVLSPYTAVLDAIDSFLTIPDNVRFLADDRICFVLSAAVVAGRQLQGLGGALPAEIHLAQELARGVRPGIAVRRMLEPACYDETRHKPGLRADRLTLAIAQYDEVDALFSSWFEHLPAQFDALASHLRSMVDLIALLRPGDPRGSLTGPVFWVRLDDRAVFRVGAYTHAGFVTQGVRFLESKQIPQSTVEIDQTPSCEFFADTVFLGALSWLQATSAVHSDVPEWVQEQFLRRAKLTLDAIRIGVAGKGPFAGLPESPDTRRILNMCAGIEIALRALGRMEVALKPLLIAFRSLGRPAVPADLALRHSGVPGPGDPVAAVAELVHATLNQPRKANPEAGAELRVAFAEFLLSRFEHRRTPGVPSASPGWDARSTEPDPAWREAYIHALLDLRANPARKVYRLLVALAANDPSDTVREAASRGKEKVRDQRSAYADISPKRAMLNAWWWLRRCHLHSVGIAVDEKEARITRLREVRE